PLSKGKFITAALMQQMEKTFLAMNSNDESVEGNLNLLTLETQEESASTDTGFKNSLDRLTVDTLTVLCSAEGLSCSGSKKELVERFASRTSNKIKGKTSDLSDILHPNDVHDNQADERPKGESRKRGFGYSDQLDEVYYTGTNKVLQESLGNTLGGDMSDRRLSEERKYMLLEKSLEKSLQAT
ncbi:9507_t:CDS:1, partial [Racocetra persica]